MLYIWLKLLVFQKHFYSNSESCYFPICFAQTKITFLIFFNKWVNKYTSICTVCTLLIRIILAFLYDLQWTHGGSNSWGKSTASGSKMEQWSVTLLPTGEPRPVDNMDSLFWSWHFEPSACTYRAINWEWCNKIYNVTIYK